MACRSALMVTVAFATVALALAAGPAAAQQGIIEVSDPRHDFGLIREGAVVRHVFALTNTGEVAFTLTAVRPSCGCTVPDWSHEPVEPGEQGRVAVEFDSNGLSGPFQKSILVESTAAPNSVTLYIEGVVEPRSVAAADTLGSLAFDGFRRALPVVKPGDALAHSIRIKNVGDEPIEITDVLTDAEYVRVEWPSEQILPGEFVEVNVAFVTSEMRRGPFIHRIDFITTDADRPAKTIRLTGLIK